MLKKIHIYDCDGVLVDTTHRYRNLPNGSIDIDYWFANCTPEKIALDVLMPLAEKYKRDLLNPEIYVIIATARLCGPADFNYFRRHLGMPNKIICRVNKKPIPDPQFKKAELQKLFNLKQFQNLTKRFWDDNVKNLYAVSELGVQCFHVQHGE